MNGLEPVVNVDTARGYRVQGTTTHRIKVVDQPPGVGVATLQRRQRGDLVPIALGSPGGRDPGCTAATHSATRTGPASTMWRCPVG